MTLTVLSEAKEPDTLAGLSSDELARLLELAQGLGGSLEFKLVLENVVGAARDLLETDMSTLLLADGDPQLLTVQAAAGIEEAVARHLSTRVGENLAGRVAETGTPMRSSDIAADRRSALGPVCESHIHSALLVPLRRNGRVLGVLGVETRELRVFTDREEAILQLLANLAAVAIATARLYEVEHDQVGRLQALVEQVNNQNDVMRRSREAHDRLSEAALEGVGHRALLRILVDVVPAPITMVNQFGVRIGAEEPSEDDRLESLWQACRDNPAFRRHFEELRGNAGLTHPAPPREGGFWRLVPVIAGGDVLGAIVVLEHDKLEELHMLILEEASSIIAAELLRERSVAEAEARSHGDLVRTLLSDEDRTMALEERAALLGHDLAATQAVVAIRGGIGSALPEPAAVTFTGRRAAARAGLRGLFGTVEDTAVVILSSGDRAVGRQSVGCWIEDFAGELRGRDLPMNLDFGVSELPCPGGAIREGFLHARQAATVCRLSDRRPVTYFEDVQLIATLIDLTNDDAVARYIDTTIGRLAEYDGRKRADLARTLETYLDCSGVARHAAKALFLHPHSLRYRLRRIAEIQGIDLEDPMTRLTTHLALKLRALAAPPG